MDNPFVAYSGYEMRGWPFSCPLNTTKEVFDVSYARIWIHPGFKGIPSSQQGKLDSEAPFVADPPHAYSNTDTNTHSISDTMVTILILVV